ncbi:protein translocase subunit SecD [Streptomyces sp. WAC 00631]|uniref:protein translocase subunit SecD n=1 Tax=Streptomyces sp. WAC 00631 TaxID=2203201 RepID=UPI001E5B1580|nr:protein translocase subunit SecD [Streptomyces sp. WAC 00631]MCC5036672.1 protein translocase subunit SecD [Streptomyces sp. WAC 00631]
MKTHATSSRAHWVRVFIALAVVAASVWLSFTKPPRLGLDLRGGTQIVLETRDSSRAEAGPEATERTLEVLRRRVDALGVTEPTITSSGERRIIVELPGVQDPRQAAEVLGRTAQLTFHPVTGAGESAREDTGEDTAEEKKEKKEKDERTLTDEDGQPLRIGPAGLSGALVEGADAGFDAQTGGGWYVTVDLRGAGKEKWRELTAEAACAPPGDPARRVAIVLDDEVISSPQVDPSVRCGGGIAGGSTRITGDFGAEDAKELALLISGGALPVPVETVEQRTVGPTLGAAAIDASARAAVIGILATSLFILAVYRFFGGLAAIALVSYGLISYAALLLLGATLTLPGLAGFVLAIGMAVDANVLVFERAREEYAARRGRSLRSALTSGYRNAFSAIADSNITTLLAAVLLFFLASGPVRGFGVTLSIGVLASMVSALVVARALTESAAGRRALRRRPGLSGIAGGGRLRRRLEGRGPGLMRHRRRWLAGSAVVLVLAVSGILVRGLDFGVEFTGGRLVEYATERPVDAEEARRAVSDAGFPRAVVQTSGDGGISVRSEDLGDEDVLRVRDALAETGGGAEKLRDELIGPSLGDELRRNALIALGVALAAQLVYLAVRFRWIFGAATVAAMAHDVLILVGVFAWLGKPVDGVFLAALLTVIGYSVNDSVVVFDRVRELWARHRDTAFAEVAGRAVVQTVPRTVNTGMGALFILVALAVLGGDSLTDFAVALLVGLTVGMFSSVLTAVPIAVELAGRSGTTAPPARKRSGPPRPRDRAAAVRPEAGDHGARV